MIKLIKSIFQKSLPNIGDRFVPKDGDPFDDIIIEIVDTKDNWVKYMYVVKPEYTPVYYTMRVKDFQKMYKVQK